MALPTAANAHQLKFKVTCRQTAVAASIPHPQPLYFAADSLFLSHSETFGVPHCDSCSSSPSWRFPEVVLFSVLSFLQCPFLGTPLLAHSQSPLSLLITAMAFILLCVYVSNQHVHLKFIQYIKHISIKT